MVIIADHHKPGHWRHDPENPFTPACAWPDDAYVQWGGSGVVISQDRDAYTTAFFEAFPKDESTGSFIRGEGKSIAEAERACFEKFMRHKACPHHWGRGSYLNGAGVCRKCGAFRSKMFAPVYIMGEWRKPLTPTEANFMQMLRDITPRDDESRRYRRKTELRLKCFGVAATEPPPQSAMEALVRKLAEPERKP